MNNEFVNVPQEIRAQYVNDLDFALGNEAGSDFYSYWIRTKEDKLKSDIKELLRIKNPYSMDLKAFTMAAMQGLCSNVIAESLTLGEEEAITSAALEIAKKTLSKLQNAQT